MTQIQGGEVMAKGSLLPQGSEGFLPPLLEAFKSQLRATVRGWGRASNRTGNNMDGLGDQTGNLDLVDSSFWLSGTGRMTSYGGVSSLDTSFEEHLLTFPIAMA